MRLSGIARKLIGWLPDVPYLKIAYRYCTHKKLNLKNPKRYGEKIQWLKLYNRNPAYTNFCDKYKVKKIVANLIGEQYVVPLLAVYDKAADIDISTLPDNFVMKTNHDSKGVMICKNKANFNLEEAKTFFKKRMKVNGYSYGREWYYKDIDRKIIVEKYLEDATGELCDYKVHCFNGKPEFIEYHQGRFTQLHAENFYDPDWNLLPFNESGMKASTETVAKPSFLKEMLELSTKLSSDIIHVRVDWYYADGRLYFGEMTFFPASGLVDYDPDDYNEKIGSLIDLNSSKVYGRSRR